MIARSRRNCSLVPWVTEDRKSANREISSEEMEDKSGEVEGYLPLFAPIFYSCARTLRLSYPGEVNYISINYGGKLIVT